MLMTIASGVAGYFLFQVRLERLISGVLQDTRSYVLSLCDNDVFLHGLRPLSI